MVCIVAILLSMDAGFIYTNWVFSRVLFVSRNPTFNGCGFHIGLIGFDWSIYEGCRNPTFNGCGFHIYCRAFECYEDDIVAILLSMDAGFIFVVNNTAQCLRVLSQSYFQWMRVSYSENCRVMLSPL